MNYLLMALYSLAPTDSHLSAPGVKCKVSSIQNGGFWIGSEHGGSITAVTSKWAKIVTSLWETMDVEGLHKLAQVGCGGG